MFNPTINLKKYLLGFGFLCLGLLLFGIASPAYASDDVCLDIKGQGLEVLKNGVPNSGMVTFEQTAGGEPLEIYEACVEHDEGPPSRAADPNFGAPGSPYYQLKGWSWDDNLGWISFYCDAAGLNLGIGCGGQEYGVTIDANGRFHGYAWGDSVGWISFEDTSGNNYHQLMVDTTNPLCQGYVYDGDVGDGAGLPDASCTGHDQGDTMVWSDNVGWIDLDGMLIPWYSLVQNIVIDFQFLPNDPRNLAKDSAPVADNSDNYTLQIDIMDDVSGLPVTPARYDVNIVPRWLKDTVKRDQTVDGDEISVGACETDTNRAVNKPCGEDPFVDTNNDAGRYDADVKSMAPTSNMNVLTSEDFSYETFISPVTMGGAQSNELTFGGVELNIYDRDAKQCAYGDDMVACTGKLIWPDNFNTPTPARLKFVPQTEVTKLEDPYDPDHEKYIDLNVGQALPFEFLTNAGPGTVDVYIGIEGVDPIALGLDFVFDANGDDVLEWLVDTDYTMTFVTDVVAGIVQDPDKSVPAIIQGLYMYTEVTEGSGPSLVKYYSNKLPRVTGATAIQPVAVIRGAVYATCALTTTTTIGAIRSLGDISTNELRDIIFRNVQGIIAGVDPPSGEVTVDSGYTNKGFKMAAGAGSVRELLLEELDGEDVPRVLYARGNVHIGATPGNIITWKGERTIIVIGGSVYIDANLYNEAPGTPRPKLGIIALKDLTATATDQAKQGNIYIHDQVNNIEANMFADGSVFRYDGSPGLKPDGRPDYLDVKAYEESAKTHQLNIKGSIASNNTIGCAIHSPKIDGWGNVTEDQLEARQYDLNYLSHYVGLIRRDPVTRQAIHGDMSEVLPGDELRIIKPDGTPWSKYESVLGPGDLWPPNDIESGTYFYAPGLVEETDLGSTYVFYDPPSATLPGFTVTGVVDITVRPN